jgi:hypothetical protein
MKTVTKAIAFCSLLCLPLGAPALAAGPIDGEVSAVWWANDFDTDSQGFSASSDAGAPGLTAQLWAFKRFGVRASQFTSDPDYADGVDYQSFDLMWRPLSPTENNFVALGLGWQYMELPGFAEETSGARVTVEGRVSLAGMVYAYGHGAYLPSLDDADATNPTVSRFEDLDAYEYEMGVAWNAMPFMDVHAGYRVNNLSFAQEPLQIAAASGSYPTAGGGGTTELVTLAEEPPVGGGGSTPAASSNAVSGEAEASGFFFGVGFHF